MNITLSTFARDNIKSNLKKCTSAQKLIFKRMYSHKDLDKSINNVVDDMEEDKLDWTMTQVQNSVDKNEG